MMRRSPKSTRNAFVGGVMSMTWIRATLALCSILFCTRDFAAAQKPKPKSKEKESAPAASSSAAATPSPMEKFKSLEFREIGPAVMGGRIDDFAVVESNPNIVFVG